MILNENSEVACSCDNKQLYADTIRHLRMTELRCATRVRTLQAGISSVLPLQLFSLMTPADAKLRTPGLPTIDLNFLKVRQSCTPTSSG